MLNRFVVSVIGAGGSGILAVTKIIEKFTKSPLSRFNLLKFNVIEKKSNLGGNTYNRPHVDPKMTTRICDVGLYYPAHLSEKINANTTLWKALDPNLIFTNDGKVDVNGYTTYSSYGYYLRSSLSESLKRNEQHVEVEFHQDEAVDSTDLNAGAVVTLNSGKLLFSNAVIISLGNFEPKPIDPSFVSHPCYFNNSDHAYHPDRVNETEDIGIIGMAQAAYSSVIAGINLGYKGRYTMTSVNGLKPHVEGLTPKAYERKIFTLEHLKIILKRQHCLEARTLAHLLTREIIVARRDGFDFRDVVDSIIPESNAIWRMLSTQEKINFYTSYYPLWAILRYRLPLEFHQITQDLITSGRLIQKSGLACVSLVNHEFKLSFKNSEEITHKKLINCTGPASDVTLIKSPLLQSLIRKGSLVPDPIGGILVNQHLQLVRAGGATNKTCYTLGPMLKGAMLEHVNMNAIRGHAETLSDSIMVDIAAKSARDLTFS